MRVSCNDVMTVAARDNNSVRPYIYVNPLQGKHIPVSPSRSLELFSLLAEKVSDRYKKERLLVIGFAETATAIGSAIALYADNVKYYISTTREDIPGSGYIRFTESHSHATDQRLSDIKLKSCLLDVDRIIFAEDEVTTGNTIEKCMKQFESQSIKYGIVSILNSMSEERLEHFSEIAVPIDYLFHVRNDPVTPECDFIPPVPISLEKPAVPPKLIETKHLWNSRIVSSKLTLESKLFQFVYNLVDQLRLSNSKQRILVLGTEEFMFPAMVLGSKIEEYSPDATVRFHATTRSPILVSADEDYPLHNRSILESFYEKGRRTNIYNLEEYDRVIVITDADVMNSDGVTSLVNALNRFGNTDVTVVRWRW